MRKANAWRLFIRTAGHWPVKSKPAQGLGAKLKDRKPQLLFELFKSSLKTCRNTMLSSWGSPSQPVFSRKNSRIPSEATCGNAQTKFDPGLGCLAPPGTGIPSATNRSGPEAITLARTQGVNAEGPCSLHGSSSARGQHQTLNLKHPLLGASSFACICLHLLASACAQSRLKLTMARRCKAGVQGECKKRRARRPSTEHELIARPTRRRLRAQVIFQTLFSLRSDDCFRSFQSEAARL